MRILAADPGLGGAIVCATVNEDTLTITDVAFRDMPVTDIIDERRLPDQSIIEQYLHDESPEVAVIEKIGPRPRGGRSSEWRFAMGYGLLLSTIFNKCDRVHLVAPNSWKRKMSLTYDKKESILLAKSLFPDYSDAIKNKDGRAEALLMIVYYVQNCMKKDGA